MTNEIEIGDRDLLLVVDMQYDFCPGGSLAVPRGDEALPIINQLGRRFRHVALTQDWHPPGHISFASSHPGRRPFETVTLAYGAQTLWPNHCVQGTRGAELHAGLDIPHAELILRKGHHPAIDSYSAFFENDRATPTGLGGYLRERGFGRIVIVGLAFDYCVRYSAEDAQRSGFGAIVIDDACRAIGANGSEAETRRSFASLGVLCVNSAAILSAAASR